MASLAHSPGPFVGRRIVVTQSAHQAYELCDLLQVRGAEPLAYPCIAIAPPEDTAPLDGALQHAANGDFDWLVVTSANTVLAVAGRLQALGLKPTALAPLSVAAVGPATAEAVEAQLGLPVALVPAEHGAEGLAAGLAAILRPGQQVLLPQADIARYILREQLAACGAKVTAVAAYRTVPGTGGVELPRMLAHREVDAITLTSASTARNLLHRLHNEGGKREHLAGVVIACIGSVTAGAARELGLSVTLVALEQTLEGLVETLESDRNHAT